MKKEIVPKNDGGKTAYYLLQGYELLLTLKRPHLFNVCSENKGCDVFQPRTLRYCFLFEELDRDRHSKLRRELEENSIVIEYYNAASTDC